MGAIDFGQNYSRTDSAPLVSIDVFQSFDNLLLACDGGDSALFLS